MLFFLFENFKIKKKRVFDILKHVFKSARIISDIYINKNASKFIDKKLFYNRRLNIKLNPGIKIYRAKNARVRVLSHDLVANDYYNSF